MWISFFVNAAFLLLLFTVLGSAEVDPLQLHDPDNKKGLLTDLRTPFLLHIVSNRDLEELTRLLMFINPTHGVCLPLHTWEILSSEFGFSGPGDLYSEERLGALQALLSVDSDNDDDDSEEVPIGHIAMKLPFNNEFVRVPSVCPIVSTPEEIDEFSANDLDVGTRLNRGWRRMFRLQVSAYRAMAGQSNAQLSAQHLEALREGKPQHVKGTPERQGPAETPRDMRERLGMGKSPLNPVNVIQMSNLVSREEEVKTGVVECDNIRHAIDTLVRQQVLSVDQRMLYLRSAEQRVCSSDVKIADDTNKPNNNENSSDVCDWRCPAYCDGVAFLTEWMLLSGSHVSVAQLHALYHHVLGQRGGNDAEMTNYFVRLQRVVYDDVERGTFASCDGLCRPPQKMRAEMQYFAGLLDLLSDSHDATPMHEGRDVLSEALWHRRARVAHVRMWAAARGGSWAAAATLSTMREFGILSPRRPRAAAALLRAAQAEDPLHFWHEVLRRDGTVGPQEMDSKGVRAWRALRFERFFGLEHSWSAVNEPPVTRAQLSAVLSEVEDTSDDEPETFGPQETLSRAVLRRLLIAQIRLAGVKGFARDVLEAECLLHEALRMLRYTCDVAHISQEDEAHFAASGARCTAHMAVLRELRLRRVPMGPCGARVVAGSFRVHTALEEALALLSYAALLSGGRHVEAARYAYLAVELSHAAHHRAHYHNNSSDATGRTELWSGGDWPRAMREYPRDFVRSPFVRAECFVLLAAAGLRAGDAGAALLSAAAESFFGAAPCAVESGCSARRAFALFRSAVRRLPVERGRGVGLLDRTPMSPRRRDALRLMAEMLSTGLLTASDVRAGDGMPRDEFFAPAEGESTEAYAKRILRAAAATHRAQWQRSNNDRDSDEDNDDDDTTDIDDDDDDYYYYDNDNDYDYDKESSAVAALAPLRAALRGRVESHDWAPLLVASDAAHWASSAQWTVLQRAAAAALDGARALFAMPTQSESLAAEFARATHPLGAGDGGGALMARALGDALLESRALRRAAVPLLLLAAALRTGEPTGLALLLAESQEAEEEEEEEEGEPQERERASRLKGVAIAVAEALSLSPGQGQGPGSLPYGGGFPVDARVELFAQVALRTGDAEAVARCCGFLVAEAMRRGAPRPPRAPYDGMRFPVASDKCLRALIARAQRTNVSPFRGVQTDAAVAALTATLADLTAAQAKYYRLSLDGRGALVDDDDEMEVDEEEGGDLMESGDEMEGDDEMEDYEDNEGVEVAGRFEVEPWRRYDVDDDGLTALSYGEGLYFNRRLHRVTGTYYAARMYGWYAAVKQWLARIGLMGS